MATTAPCLSRVRPSLAESGAGGGRANAGRVSERTRRGSGGVRDDGGGIGGCRAVRGHVCWAGQRLRACASGVSVSAVDGGGSWICRGLLEVAASRGGGSGEPFAAGGDRVWNVCAECRYSLNGLPHDQGRVICPECGQVQMGADWRDGAESGASKTAETTGAPPDSAYDRHSRKT